jgi:ribonuclease HII
MKGLDFSFEKAYWQQGKNIVVGIDEVGRGPLAGPVVVGAVALSADCALVEGVLDSKKISKKKHSLRAQQLKESGLAYGIGVGTVEQINLYGIVKAIQIAIEESLKNIPEYHQVVIDGLAFKEAFHLKSEVDFIVKGDSK